MGRRGAYIRRFTPVESCIHSDFLLAHENVCTQLETRLCFNSLKQTFTTLHHCECVFSETYSPPHKLLNVKGILNKRALGKPNEISDCIQCGKYFDYLSDNQLIEKNLSHGVTYLTCLSLSDSDLSPFCLI